jgi:hypothetical protein
VNEETMHSIKSYEIPIPSSVLSVYLQSPIIF